MSAQEYAAYEPADGEYHSQLIVQGTIEKPCYPKRDNDAAEWQSVGKKSSAQQICRRQLKFHLVSSL